MQQSRAQPTLLCPHLLRLSSGGFREFRSSSTHLDSFSRAAPCWTRERRCFIRVTFLLASRAKVFVYCFALSMDPEKEGRMKRRRVRRGKFFLGGGCALTSCVMQAPFIPRHGTFSWEDTRFKRQMGLKQRKRNKSNAGTKRKTGTRGRENGPAGGTDSLALPLV